MKILGLRHGHDASACLVIDGEIVADVAEERFTRKKNDGSFPELAIDFCLKHAGIASTELDAVALSSTKVTPTLKAFFPGGRAEQSDRSSSPSLLKAAIQKARGRTADAGVQLPTYLRRFPVREDCRLLGVNHHLAHAASAYYTSGFFDEKALVVTLDARGDGVSATVWRGHRNTLEKLASFDGTASLGWFYSAVTEALDWRHGSDEWKVMGLAPYGTPQPGLFDGFHPEFEDGRLTKPHQFGKPHRFPDHGCNHYHLDDALRMKELLSKVSREDFAAEAQRVVEEQAERLIYPWLDREGMRLLCCAGGFFLNVKFNQRLWYSNRVDDQWIYPNPGDSGGAAGAALAMYYREHPERRHRRLSHLYGGPSFDDDEIRQILDDRKLEYEQLDDVEGTTAKLLVENRIVAWFQGAMEAGPRALGSRSILMSPLAAENKDLINACVKYREMFRPFCPSMLAERADDYLENSRLERFMVTSFRVKADKVDRIPAVVHVDGTARPQMVERDVNPRYHRLIEAFGEITGEPVVLNTSFNIKGEPIVCHPREAIKCFMDTGLDALVLGSFLLRKPRA